ncbi:GGDEF domain-containing protein, partial [Acinetobacter baumannii]
KGQFTLAIFDLDRFKPINDNYGHTAGDAALKAFASLLRKVVGEKGIVGRIGGDEFVVLFTEPEQVATSIARRFQVELSKTDISIPGR